MSTSRDFLLARLAAERARLLHTLIGVSEADLTTKPVHDEWTAANILAHIGDWDRFFCWRIEKVLEGSASVIPSIEGPHERNPAVHEAIRHMTLDEAVMEIQSARAAFLRTLAQVDDAMLGKMQDVSWGRVKISTWAAWRGKHDFNHAKDFRKWKRGLSRSEWNLPRSPLRAALKAACDDFLVTVRQIADEDGDRVMGDGITLTRVVRRVANAQIVSIAQLRGMPVQQTVPDDAPYAQAWQLFRRSYVLLEDMLTNMNEGDLTPIVYQAMVASTERMMIEAAGIRGAVGVKWPRRLLRSV